MNISNEQEVGLGPESLLWHYAGDLRIGFTGLSAGVLQLMHPGIGAAVAEHSEFFNEPWQRIERSLPWILGVIYDPEPEVTGKQVRDFHKDFKGDDAQGRHYSALQAETYWWAHATFQDMIEQEIDRFSQRTLSMVDREKLYEEGRAWYGRYGMGSRPVPINYFAFKEKWDHICNDVLELTPAAERAVDMALSRDVDRIPMIPPLIWKLLGRVPASEFVRVTTIGGLPSAVRDRFDIPWSEFDQFELDSFEKVVRSSWRFVHPKLRYHPRARAGNNIAKKLAA
ncbi:MAG TPA: oxygenase MpaB family protein [Patescibacteria group bacterium]|nr:oxygenase MpaB family protein [Patescibacteria group bacterium]